MMYHAPEGNSCGTAIMPVVCDHERHHMKAEAVIGEGKPVLLLHGWGANLSLVWSMAENLARLGYRVYALDLPGFGQSDPPPAAWTVFDYARFVVAYLDYHRLERVYLFGPS